jgi:beta-lactamase superfamily II metal-dependent hydrolase
VNAKHRAGKIITIVMMAILFSVFALDIMTVLLCNQYERRYPVTQETFAGYPAGADRGSAEASDGQAAGQGNKIHFLNTDNSDCILLESGGRFAMVDSGWGSNNPRKSARREGYEQRVIDYLKKVAAGLDGKVTLDFILCTHYHYDHAGGFSGILRDPDITVKTCYLRSLQTTNQHEYEIESWDIDSIHREVVAAAEERGFPIEEHPPAEPFAFGDMTLRFLNLDSYENPKYKGENDNSVLTLITCGGTKALLAADASNLHGMESRLAPEIGRVDLLKLCHHGYAMSNSMRLLRALRPKVGIVTNGLGQIYPNVKWNLTMVSHTSVFSTVKENGVIATLSPNGGITLTGNLHER